MNFKQIGFINIEYINLVLMKFKQIGFIDDK